MQRDPMDDLPFEKTEIHITLGNGTVKNEGADLFRCTDLGNGERLIARYGDDLRYCNPWKKWLTWDSARWAIDHTQTVRQWARMTIRSIYDEAARLATLTQHEAAEEKKNILAKRAGRLLMWAVKSEGEPRTNAMLHNAQMDAPVKPDDLDVDPWLLNVENGTLDLHTGTLREHRREDLLTKIIPFAYDPDATWLSDRNRTKMAAKKIGKTLGRCPVSSDSPVTR